MTKNIELTKGAFAIVDDEDFEELSQYKWFLHKDGYAVRNIRLGVNKRTAQMMHRVIMDTEKGFEVDHIDGNKLNNCKENLRNCTHKQNMRNLKKRSDGISIYKGVGWQENCNKWSASVGHEGVTLYFGLYEDEKDAAYIYNEWALKTFGEYAKLNDIGDHVLSERYEKKKVRVSKHKYINWYEAYKVWRVNVKGKHIGTFKDLNKAIEKRDEILSTLN